MISPARVITVAWHGPLADVAAAAAGVAVQRAADRAGNADQRFQSGQSLAHGDVEIACPSLAPPPAVTVCLLTVISLNAGALSRIDQPADAFVAHQNVRAAAQQCARAVLLRERAVHQRAQVLDASAVRRSTRPARPGETTCAAPAAQPA